MSSMICQQQLKCRASSCHFSYYSCLFPSTSLLTVSAVAEGLVSMPAVLLFMPSVSPSVRHKSTTNTDQYHVRVPTESASCQHHSLSQSSVSPPSGYIAPSSLRYAGKKKKTCLPCFAE